jgi:integrase/recombinase XerD
METPHRLSPKSAAKKITVLLASQKPDAVYVKKIFQYVRENLGFTGQSQRSPQKLPELLSDSEMTSFYRSVLKEANPTHMVMVKMLLFTGIRNQELVGLEPRDVDLEGPKVRVRQGKGGKDRDIPLPDSFRAELTLYLDRQKNLGARFLFESRLLDQYTTRRIRQILKHYADLAGVTKRLYPHLFRHQLLTHLTRQGVVDAHLQLVSGHASRQSLAIYQKLSLADVQPRYQQAMREFPVR